MSGNKFDTDEEVQRILQAVLTGRTVSGIEAALADAFPLEKAARVYIAEALEKALVPDVMVGDFPPEQRDVVRAAASSIERARKTDALRCRMLETLSDAAVYNCFTPVVLFIADAKGDAASPFIKVFADEVLDLSSTEKTFPENLMRVMCNAADRAQGIIPPRPKKGRPNPPSP